MPLDLILKIIRAVVWIPTLVVVGIILFSDPKAKRKKERRKAVRLRKSIEESKKQSKQKQAEMISGEKKDRLIQELEKDNKLSSKRDTKKNKKTFSQIMRVIEKSKKASDQQAQKNIVAKRDRLICEIKKDNDHSNKITELDNAKL